MKWVVRNSQGDLQVVGAIGFVPKDAICQAPEDAGPDDGECLDLIQVLDKDGNEVEGKFRAAYNPSRRSSKNSRIDQEAIDRKWAKIRDQRDLLLLKCDYVLGKDSPVSLDGQAAWVTYRQALRDITKQSDPDNITWPVKPA